MLNRWIGILSAIGMICVSTALIWRDVIPGLLAGDPPDSDAGLTRGEFRKVQVGIFDARGNLIGQSWTVARNNGVSLDVNSSTLLQPIPLPDGVRTPTVRIDTLLAYHQQSRVDRLEMRVHGLPARISLSGRYFPPDEFPCQWQVGPMKGHFSLSAEATRALGDVVRPFDRLPGLYVGRSWRIELFNPLAQFMPGWKGANVSVNGLLVRVTAKERIIHNEDSVECFRVETDRATAWVDDTGRVLRQTVDLPVLGSLTLVDQPFDEAAREDARKLFASNSMESEP